MTSDRSSRGPLCGLLAALLLSPGPAAGEPNLLGLNFVGPVDFSPAQVFADVVRQSREILDPSGRPSVAVDRDGWPLADDFHFLVWDTGTRQEGTYRLTLVGKVGEIRASAGVLRPEGGSWAAAHDPSGNVTRATLVIRASDAHRGTHSLELYFSGAQRNDGSGRAGVARVQLMRPVSPGAEETHAPTELFNRNLLALLGKVQVVRFMDFTGTWPSQQVHWSDRPLPSWMSFNRRRNEDGYGWQGIGGAWEHVVLLANQIERDAWICIPHRATDAYVRQVAQLFAFGSDGVLPFTGPYGSAPDPRTNPRPAPHPPSSWKPGTTAWYPPLKARLRLYVENGNEGWNPAGGPHSDYQHNLDAAQAEVQAGGSDLDYDGTGKKMAAARRLARRGLEISNLFREVFGDGQMPLTGNARVRPILASQQDWADGWLGPMLKYLWGYWNNGEGQHVRAPHPPTYYFHGAGGSSYYPPADWQGRWTVDPVTVDSLWRSFAMDPEFYRSRLLENEAHRCAGMGLRRVAYEGGPDFAGTRGHAEVMRAAADDPRMRESVLEHHRVWSEMGGDLNVYFTAVGDYQWGWARDASRPGDTPKMQALEELAAGARAAPVIGVAIPGAAPGAAHAGCSAPYEPPAPRALGSRTFRASPAEQRWATYLFRAAEDAPRRVTVTLGRADGRASVFLDGRLLGTGAAVNGPVAYAAGRVPAGLHGVLVQVEEGSFVLERVAVE